MNRLMLEARVKRLERLVYNKYKMFEGGAAGHMKHIYDYTDLTLADVKNIITNLFSGKGEVTDITEKLDGMNIQCTLNNDGVLVFVRNKSDLNSKVGGMTRDDVVARWTGKDHVLEVYLSAYDTIDEVFQKIGKEFFNPDENTKILANCECIIAGKTNILMYANAQVDFHNLWVYTRKNKNSQWEKSEVTRDGIEVLERACEGITGAQLTPKVSIRTTDESRKLLTSYINDIDSIFKAAGCSDNSTIDEYRHARFVDLCADEYPWILKNPNGTEVLYDRWFNDNKSVNLREIKKMYKDILVNLHLVDSVDLNSVTKFINSVDSVDSKEIVFTCMQPLDLFFSMFGNTIISLCDGIVNAGIKSKVIDTLRNDLKEIVSEINANGSDELKDKLTTQLKRLDKLGNKLNAAEGIVFKYGDRLMKCTGSFASVNQILGMRFQM